MKPDFYFSQSGPINRVEDVRDRSWTFVGVEFHNAISGFVLNGSKSQIVAVCMKA